MYYIRGIKKLTFYFFMMANVIDLTSETPSEPLNNIPLLEPVLTFDEYSGTSENSDESQPIKKRSRGRPKNSGKGKYTVNPNQKRGTKLGKTYVIQKNKTNEQLERSHLMRRKNNLDHYYRVRAMVLETQRIVEERETRITNILNALKLKLELESTETLARLESSPLNLNQQP